MIFFKRQTPIQKAFEDAVVTARDMYPEAKNTQFADLTTRKGRRILKNWAKDNTYSISQTVKRIRNYGQSLHFLPITNTDGPSIICMQGDNIFFQDTKKEMLFTFWHEFGHSLDPKCRPSETDRVLTVEEDICETNAKEITADVFASLHGLKQQFLTTADVQSISNFRKNYAQLNNEWTHHTTNALNNLLNVEVPAMDALSLTPAEIKKIALRHADETPFDLSLLNIPDVHFKMKAR